jgi:hypothetical protein
MPVDLRAIVLPLQLMTHVRTGDTLHFAGEREPFRVLSSNHETGLVQLERDWAGPTFSEWLQTRAGVTGGG